MPHAAADPHNPPPRRILVAGASGAGKSTLARRIAAASGLPFQEIDALFHGPDWTPRPSFVADVDAFTSQPGWVTEWQYDSARELLADRAQVLVFLDYSRARVMRQVVVRTVRRRVRREELWNGNLEPSLTTIFSDPEHIIRWAWNTHGSRGELVADAARRRPHLEVVRLRNPREAEAWLATTYPFHSGR
ncbi:adenylate kinase family enzyme [Agromyces hippuratus]|uniref:Adenylate kinase family enzyme n=1 Tax=Agromyces hippuratus TaxID=286438 RepID=A0A852WQH1_9MICO|nr:AAA family ATPase [Agromyces hippuratus]NYG19788.1 adenylate kinase family enzyme [Agromyces hippuratus]